MVCVSDNLDKDCLCGPTLAVGLAGWYFPVSSAQGHLEANIAHQVLPLTDILGGLNQSMGTKMPSYIEE